MTCRGRAVGVKPDGLGLGLSKGAWPGRGKQPGRDAGRRAGYVTKGRVEPGLEISLKRMEGVCVASSASEDAHRHKRTCS